MDVIINHPWPLLSRRGISKDAIRLRVFLSLGKGDLKMGLKSYFTVLFS